MKKSRRGFIPLEISRLKRLPPRLRRGGLLTGFTLLETLIYIALLSLALGFSIIVFYQISDSQARNKLKTGTTDEANFLMQKISWVFSGAQTINLLAAGSSSATLSLNKYNFSQNPFVFVFSSSTITLSRAGGQPSPLLSSNVRISSLSIIYGALSGNSLNMVQIFFQNGFSSSTKTYECEADDKQSIASSSFLFPPTVNCRLPEFVYISFTLISSSTSILGMPASTTLTNTFYLKK